MRQFAWSWPEPSAEGIRRGQEIARALSVPEPVGQALASRGMDALGASYIGNRSLRQCTEDMGDPPGVEQAAAKLLDTGRKGKVGVICDYDVDGAASQAILIETLRAALPAKSPDPMVVVPERNTEGFGPNARCLNQLVQHGALAVAILDCGTASGKLLDRFHKLTGIEIVVVDHHPPHEDSPPSTGAIVNPWVSRGPDPGEQGTLCAAGLTWFVALAILRQSGLPPAETLEVRKRITLLAALGTSCDMMRIDTPFNRALIRVGVKLLGIPEVRSPGLDGLCKATGLNRAPRSDDFGWRIGPRLNAGSRMGESALAARCLRERKPDAAVKLADELDEHNQARRALGEKSERELNASDSLAAFEEGPVNLFVAESATPGTTGLVASSLVKRFGWPAIVLSARGRDRLAGSGRSSLEFDIGAAVSAARKDGVLLSGGGHAAACGLELKRDRLEDLRAFMVDRFRQHADTSDGPGEPTLEIDAELNGQYLSGEGMLAIADAQRQLEPWGQGLPSPLFGVKDCSVYGQTRHKKGHVFLTCAKGSTRFEAVWWRAPPDWQSRIGMDTADGEPSLINVAGQVGLDEWQGRRDGRIVVRDIAVASE